MLDRRHFLTTCAGLGTIALPDRLLAARKTATGRLAFRLKETAGLRRFGYPVHAVLPSRAVATGLKYRLVRGGKEITAQFREVSPEADHPSVVLDFNASPGPFEAEEYTVEFGSGVKPGVEPSRGLVAGHEAGTFRVANSPYLSFEIPEDLAGLIASIKSSKLEFVTPHSRGLFLGIDGARDDGSRFKLTGDGNEPVARWTKKGPIAVGLRFRGTIAAPSGKPLRTTVDLGFVNSKSWIETNWTVEDPDDRVDSLGVDLAMKLEGTPALVDCGASSTVYSQLRTAETLSFTGHPPAATGDRRPSWIVEHGGKDGRRPFAIAGPSDHAPEGWIHLMDHARCSALAVADFAVAGTDRFLVESTGRIEVERRFEKTVRPPEPGRPKSLKFWLHVVPTPVQVGAATSPQSMLAPLTIEWIA